MSSLPSLPSPKTVFGKAFLVELERGNIQRAMLFAKAFLALETAPYVRINGESALPLLMN